MDVRIKDILKEKGITAKELADKLGVAEMTLSRASRGNTSLQLLEKISLELGVSISDLFEKQSHDTTLTCPKCGTTLELTLKE